MYNLVIATALAEKSSSASSDSAVDNGYVPDVSNARKPRRVYCVVPCRAFSNAKFS